MNDLYHFGIKGMKWGVRRYQNKDGSLTPAGKKRQNRDMDKLENASRKAGKALSKYLDFKSAHTYSVSGIDRISSIYVENPGLRRKAERYSKKVDSLVEKMSKKYGKVSAIPDKDANTGKMYVDITINGKTRRINDVQ